MFPALDIVMLQYIMIAQHACSMNVTSLAFPAYTRSSNISRHVRTGSASHKCHDAGLGGSGGGIAGRLQQIGARGDGPGGAIWQAHFLPILIKPQSVTLTATASCMPGSLSIKHARGVYGFAATRCNSSSCQELPGVKHLAIHEPRMPYQVGCNETYEHREDSEL